MRIGLLTLDSKGGIALFNAAAEQILGYGREEVIGKRIEMLFSDPTERDAAIAQLKFKDHVVKGTSAKAQRSSKERFSIKTE